MQVKQRIIDFFTFLLNISLIWAFPPKHVQRKTVAKRICIYTRYSHEEVKVASKEGDNTINVSYSADENDQMAKAPSLSYSGKNPKKSKPIVIGKGMNQDDITDLLQELLVRLTKTENDLKLIKRKLEGTSAEIQSSRRHPQKFVIDRRATTIGAGVAGGIGGMVLGWSIFVNLWLVGAVTGAAASSFFSTTDGPVGTLLKNIGIQIALVYKDVKDFYEQTLFLYRTGKLSYKYWTIWEEYDKRFKLTDKYTEVLKRISKEADELDQQYKVRSKIVGIWGKAQQKALIAGSTASRSAVQFLKNATGFGEDVLVQLDRQRKTDKRGWHIRGNGNKATTWSPYSPPPKGEKYPSTPKNMMERLLMTPAQWKNEQLKKDRVKFMGMK